MTLITTQMKDLHDNNDLLFNKFDERDSFISFLEKLCNQKNLYSFTAITSQLQRFFKNDINVLSTPPYINTSMQWPSPGKMSIRLKGDDKCANVSSSVSLCYEITGSQHEFTLLWDSEDFLNKRPIGKIRIVGRIIDDEVDISIYCNDKEVSIMPSEDFYTSLNTMVVSSN